MRSVRRRRRRASATSRGWHGTCSAALIMLREPFTENVAEPLPVMLWRARPDMSCEYLSRQWLDFTGCREDEALGDGWSRSVHAEDLARWLDTLVRSFDAREPFEIEYRLRRRDGEY